ncbi:MAG: NADH:ubiquinone reductase (Na(+)-transporting) subunit F [Propionivibrio sp.]
MSDSVTKAGWLDYSLVGPNARLAVEKGLADAVWYTSPVSRETMRDLLKRRNGPAVRDTLLWFALLAVFAYAGYRLWGSAWTILPFAAYGVLYASVSDSRWHESSHGTAFKTDWLNNALYELASFMVLRESVPWRWSHTRHHSDTIIVGLDPEIASPRPANLRVLFLNFFNVMALRNYVRNVLLHCIGRITPEERTYIPESEFPRVFLRARLYVLVYAGVIGLALYTGSLLPLMYVGLPSFYGAWLMVVYGYTQHAGLAENVLDHRLNCRTVYMNRLNRYLYWNMNYHVEHHMFPLVPYHALPRLHALIKADCPTPYAGLLDAYREIVPALFRQARDPSYYVKRPLPAPSAPVAAPPVAARALVNGWLDVCGSGEIGREEAHRFDHEQCSFALYRTADDRVHATDGFCTHGNAHLADGLVKGNLIECAKHNGRFDVRDGSPVRLPVCVGLKTYVVKEVDGRLWVNVATAGGAGVTNAAATYHFRVVSNRNVATFIKELVLEPLDGHPAPRYQPGDYLQLDIPAYAERSLQTIDVDAPYSTVWQTQNVHTLTAANPAPCRRNYSLASNPERESALRFNVRLATPPRGVDAKAGIGSSYVFGLRPGDVISAIGPFGDFHVKDTEREMVYLGGGAGMAPLRAHLSHLLETRNSTARISYWYGARSRQELFYEDYFADLARVHANFSFHVALSEALADDAWTGATGFVHEVLKRDYLDAHADPRNIDFFLCGPPAMIHAAREMLAGFGVDPSRIAFDEF